MVELALRPGRDADLVEGRQSRRSGRPAARRRRSRRAQRGARPSPARAAKPGRGANAYTGASARAPPHGAGSRPAAPPRSRAGRARRRSGMRRVPGWLRRHGPRRLERWRWLRESSTAAPADIVWPDAGLRSSGWSWRVLPPPRWTRADGSRRRTASVLARRPAPPPARARRPDRGRGGERGRRRSSADAFWALVLLPAWIVIAKLIGLYDRDHAAIRHLTVRRAAGAHRLGRRGRRAARARPAADPGRRGGAARRRRGLPGRRRRRPASCAPRRAGSGAG